MDELSANSRYVEPTPAEIEACCVKIRASWNSRTLRLRAGLPPAGFTVEVGETSFAALTRRRASTVEVD